MQLCLDKLRKCIVYTFGFPRGPLRRTEKTTKRFHLKMRQLLQQVKLCKQCKEVLPFGYTCPLQATQTVIIKI